MSAARPSFCGRVLFYTFVQGVCYLSNARVYQSHNCADRLLDCPSLIPVESSLSRLRSLRTCSASTILEGV
jgi:hypothetical protein